MRSSLLALVGLGMFLSPAVAQGPDNADPNHIAPLTREQIEEMLPDSFTVTTDRLDKVKRCKLVLTALRNSGGVFQKADPNRCGARTGAPVASMESIMLSNQEPVKMVKAEPTKVVKAEPTRRYHHRYKHLARRKGIHHQWVASR